MKSNHKLSQNITLYIIVNVNAKVNNPIKNPNLVNFQLALKLFEIVILLLSVLQWYK